MRDEINRIQAADIKAAIRDAASDPLFLVDVEETTAAFRWAARTQRVKKQFRRDRRLPAEDAEKICKQKPTTDLSGVDMPTISMFYGILILMFFRDNRRHHLPHIHARYQGDEAAVSIDDGAILDGSLPSKQLKMVQAWIEIHKEELLVDWDLAVNGEEPFRIAPLQ